MPEPKSISLGVPAYNFEFTNEQVFSLKNFYKYVHDWMVEEGFDCLNGKEVPEVFYAEKRSQSGMRENRIWWRFKMSTDNPRITYFVNINWLILAMTDTQAVVGGEKMKAQKGEVNMFVTSFMETEYADIKKNKIFNIPFFANMFHTFEKKVHRPLKEGYEKELVDMMKRLQEELKSYLSLNSYGAQGESFHPKKGL